MGCLPPTYWPYPSMHWLGGCASQHALGRGCVSQHALGRGVCIPACTGQGVYIPACTGQWGVYPSMHWAGGCVFQHALGRGCLLGGGLPRGCLPRGLSDWGCGRHPPDQRQTPPCEQNDWQTGVKTLPCRNFVAGGKNFQRLKVTCSRIWSNNPGLLIQYSTYWSILT